jgi:uncharacterized membrane protein YjgN (DUF898 family)
MSQRMTIAVVYEGRGRDILMWCVGTAALSLTTLGLYLPIALNDLVRYLCDSTEVQVRQS